MPVSIEELRPHLQAFDFPRLFVEGLGWDHFQGESLALPIDGHEYALKPVAEKASFAVFECAPGPDGVIPAYPVRRKIEAQVVKRAFEHLIIFVDADRTQQIWQWVKRQAGKPAACREHRFHAGQTGHPLLQRLDSFIFTLEDEARGIGISDVATRAGKTFDVEKITKRFYDRFQQELKAFRSFVQGITEIGQSTDKHDWYASLMLNRMMFVYFVQKQGFLDGDTDYLRNRLKMVREQSGGLSDGQAGGRFQQFYRLFLLRLFHEGLGQPEAQRAPDLAALLGRVPFLNGGLFDVHDLERDNPDISIPDAAFDRVFDFFDGYRWHLDERPYREDNEINPDVLGYIFEKYVNQKQMGAYYTKEDITGYISRNTVIPFLFDAARKECPVAFGPDGGIWRLLRDDPDRYIYPAVGHGIVWNARQPEAPISLDAPFDLPEDIAAGIDDVSKRGGWNATAMEEHALPTEIWREVVARRQRYEEVRVKLASGEVQEINDLITLNLDVERFARDVIAQSEGPELLRAFWHALYGNQERSDTGISVLDPTCGSGAFLFAALNVLEPLYTACLEGMRGFLDDAERSERKRSPEHLGDFRRILEQVDKHPSERYFILKSSVLNNLYGVDIMGEAVEICRLRLFLKLVAQLESYDQIEPLPDIDFNVRAGNTLVGFTSLETVRQAMTVMPNGQHRQVFPEDQAALDRINEEAQIASAAFNQFRWQQTMLGGEVTATEKATLRQRLVRLSEELDRYLATEYGIERKNSAAHDAWRTSHHPFHWFVEFYGIMGKGGFDVVIGNPPYVEYNKVKDDYTIRDYVTESCGNLYAYTMERSMTLMNVMGRFSFITPISITAAQRMAILQSYLFEHSSTIWLSNFALRPAALFPGVMQRNTICITKKGKGRDAYTTDYMTWYSEERPVLFHKLSYLEIGKLRQDYSIPKVNVRAGSTALSKALSKTIRWKSHREFKGSNKVYYHNAGGYWIKTFAFRPYYRSLIDQSKKHTTMSELRTPSAELASLYCALLNSNLFYFFWKSLTDARHVYPSDIAMFPVDLEEVTQSSSELSVLVSSLMDELRRNSKRIVYGKAEVDQFHVAPCKPTIDKIDRVLAKHYGFTEEELDFIINYDIKYRMG